MMEAHPGVSDLLFSVGRPFQVESYGELKQVDIHPDVQRLTATQTEMLALNIIGDDRRLIKELLMMGSCDCSYALNDRVRFRVNIFKQRGNFAIVMRKPQTEIPSLNSLGPARRSSRISPARKTASSSSPAPPAAARRPRSRAILNEINEIAGRPRRHARGPHRIRPPAQERHLLPARTRARISTIIPAACAPPCARRPRSSSWAKCATARRSRSPSPPRKPATSSSAPSTPSTPARPSTASPACSSRREEKQLRLRLADTLRYVVSQRLAPKRGGGRAPAHRGHGHQPARRARPSPSAKPSTAPSTTSSSPTRPSAGTPSTSPSPAATRPTAHRGDRQSLRHAQRQGHPLRWTTRKSAAASPPTTSAACASTRSCRPSPHARRLPGSLTLDR